MRRPERAPDLEVELRLFPTEESGLNRSLPQGCRLPNDFGLEAEMNDAMYIFRVDPPSPGGTAKAELWLLVPERNAGRLREGSRFYPWHMRLIGEGTVLQIINPDLRTGAWQD
jgi:hypothetical protein